MMNLRRLVSGSCIDTLMTLRQPSTSRRCAVNIGSIATRFIRLDSLGVTCEMIEVKIGFRLRVIAVTSMYALYSWRFT